MIFYALAELGYIFLWLLIRKPDDFFLILNEKCIIKAYEIINKYREQRRVIIYFLTRRKLLQMQKDLFVKTVERKVKLNR